MPSTTQKNPSATSNASMSSNISHSTNLSPLTTSGSFHDEAKLQSIRTLAQRMQNYDLFSQVHHFVQRTVLSDTPGLMVNATVTPNAVQPKLEAATGLKSFPTEYALFPVAS